MSAGAVIGLAVIIAAVTLNILIILRVLWRRAVRRESAARLDSMIEVVKPSRPVTDPFLINLEAELARDRKARGDVSG